MAKQQQIVVHSVIRVDGKVYGALWQFHIRWKSKYWTSYKRNDSYL